MTSECKVEALDPLSNSKFIGKKFSAKNNRIVVIAFNNGIKYEALRRFFVYLSKYYDYSRHSFLFFTDDLTESQTLFKKAAKDLFVDADYSFVRGSWLKNKFFVKYGVYLTHKFLVEKTSFRQKILYLDCDMLIQGNVFDLTCRLNSDEMHLCLEQTFPYSSNLYVNIMNPDKSIYKEGLKASNLAEVQRLFFTSCLDNHFYFPTINTGVMVFSSKFMQELCKAIKLNSDFVKLFNLRKHPYLEQLAVNKHLHLFRKRVKFLDPVFNWQLQNAHNEVYSTKKGFFTRNDEPVINLHFNGDLGKKREKTVKEVVESWEQ